MTAMFVPPIAHHLVEAVPFVVPVVLLPLVLLGLAVRDRLRGRGRGDGRGLVADAAGADLGTERGPSGNNCP